MQAFRQGLGQTGYIEGRNVTIEYRWADGHNDRLPSLAADLLRREVTVIVAPGGSPAGLAAKALTTTVPIVFEAGADPVAVGLVDSLNRPGGNVTGVSSLNAEIAPKRLEIMHALVSGAATIGVLVDPTGPTSASQIRDLKTAAEALGLGLVFVDASNAQEVEAALTSLVQQRAGALVINSGPIFASSLNERLATLSLQHMMPAISQSRDFPAAGGLVGYGGDITELHRQAGIYTGRILKGESPAELPVQQVTKVALVINLATARSLGITVPISLLATADEVIE